MQMPGPSLWSQGREERMARAVVVVGRAVRWMRGWRSIALRVVASRFGGGLGAAGVD